MKEESADFHPIILREKKDCRLRHFGKKCLELETVPPQAKARPMEGKVSVSDSISKLKRNYFLNCCKCRCVAFSDAGERVGSTRSQKSLLRPCTKPPISHIGRKLIG